MVKINQRGIALAVEILKSGGVIAHPADTCFGLAADFANRKALKKIQAIKGRDGQKPMSIMLPAAFKDQLEKFAVLNDFTRTICDKLLPGPVTILLPKGPAIPRFYFPETDLIGIRIPYDSFTQDLLNAFRAPLITTSANCSGKPCCYSHEDVAKSLGKKIDMLDLVFEFAMSERLLPSTVILPQKNKIRIIRKGPMTASQMKNILGVQIIK